MVKYLISRKKLYYSSLHYSKMAFSYDFWLRLKTYEVGDDEVSDKPEEAGCPGSELSLQGGHVMPQEVQAANQRRRAKQQAGPG